MSPQEQSADGRDINAQGHITQAGSDFLSRCAKGSENLDQRDPTVIETGLLSPRCVLFRRALEQHALWMFCSADDLYILSEPERFRIDSRYIASRAFDPKRSTNWTRYRTKQ